MAYINRRNFLQRSSALGFMGGAGALGALNGVKASAATTGGYKALVCVFFKGGMDSLDTVLPYDAASHADLQGLRAGIFDQYGAGSGSSSRDIENMLELSASNIGDFEGRQFALPEDMAPLHDMFEAGDAAVIGNVGPLIEPTTRDTMNNYSAQIPQRLFSHNDQQSTWMSLAVEGAQTGWGGKFADAAIRSDMSTNPIFSSITASSADVFLSGDLALPFVAPAGGVQAIDILSQKWRIGYGSDADQVRAILKEHIASRDMDPSNLFTADIAARNGRAVENNEAYSNAINGSVGLSAAFPESNLGGQLKSVADTISVRNTLGGPRQVFYVTMGGFDTHDRQANELPQLQADMATSFAAFKQAMVEMGVWNDVTMFTASDFGRTAIGNGDGTDHGWGAHHFVMGGAVAGKKIYGSLPSYDLSDQAYTDDSGRLIPSVSVDQYAATLGRWFGLNDSELSDALPNLNNFTQKDLGLFEALS